MAEELTITKGSEQTVLFESSIISSLGRSAIPY